MKVKKIISENKTQIMDLHELYGSNFHFAYNYYEQLSKDNKLRQYKEVEAIALWRKMLTMVYETGYPWLCLSKNTKIAVADGRESVTIKELAEINEKFPVYSINHTNKNQRETIEEIKYATAFKNGTKELIKIYLDDGSYFECTENHRISLKNGDYVKAKDSLGKSLFPFNDKHDQTEQTSNHKVKVIKIERTEKIEDVYDLSVEDNHNFFIITNETDQFKSGILVHNCFKDPSNIRNPQQHDGVVHSSNLCCMTGDQRVVTDKGLLTVKELYDLGCENKVVGLNGYENASKMIRPKLNSPIVKIGTRDGYSHKVTPDHKVWVVDKGWVEARDLKKDDKLLLQQVEGLFGNFDDLQIIKNTANLINTKYVPVLGRPGVFEFDDIKYQFPEYIWKSSKRGVLFFLNILYEQSYEQYNKLFIFSQNLRFLKNIQLLWSNLNIKTTLYSERKHVYKLAISVNDFKHVIYDNKSMTEVSDNYTIFDGLTIVPNEDVYCLTVDSDTHAWTVNGMITKNTEITLNTKANEEVAVCFPTGTMIMTDDGLSPIEKCNGKNIYVPYDGGLNRQKKYLKGKLLNQGKKDIWEIYVDNGYYIKTTENHPFLTINNKNEYHWKEVKKIQVNDKLVIFDNDSEFNGNIFLKSTNNNEMRLLIFNNLTINSDNFEINTSDNIKLLRQLQLWLLLFNISSEIKTYTLKINDKRSMTYFLNEFSELFNNHDVMINSIYNCENEVINNFAEVSHIKNTKIKDNVYDISLEKDHNFVANGFVVHNCNLSAINLSNHVDNDGLNVEKLKKTIKIAVRALDNVIDINFYPIPEAENSNKKHRPIGLGIMGFQDILYKLKIPYESEEAIELADQIQEIISYYAVKNSHELAMEKGSYSTFDGSLWSKGILALDSLEKLINERGDNINVNTKSTLDWNSLKKDVVKGMRNSNVTTIQPTATISNICGVTQSIEPSYQQLYVKSNLSGEFTIVNPYLIDDLKNIGIWDEEMISDLKEFDGKLEHIDRIPEHIKKLYKTSFEIDQKYLVECASRRQKWVDQAISLNLYLIEPTGKKLDTLFKTIWKSGLKSSYYLRSMGASHIKKTTITKKPNTNNFININNNNQACGIDDTECESCQ